MENLNFIDITILVIFGLSTLSGFARGIVREFLSILKWIAAFVLSTMYAGKLANSFTDISGVQTVISDSSNALGSSTSESASMLALGLSYVSIFLGVLVVGSLIVYIIAGLVEGVGIGLVNRFFGALFGLLRGFLINLILVFMVQLTDFDQEKWWQQSKLVPLFEPAATAIEKSIKPDLLSFKAKITDTIQDGTTAIMDKVNDVAGSVGGAAGDDDFGASYKNIFNQLTP